MCTFVHQARGRGVVVFNDPVVEQLRAMPLSMNLDFKFHNLHCAHGEMGTHWALSKKEIPDRLATEATAFRLHHCMESASKHSRGWKGNSSRSTLVPESRAGAVQRSGSLTEIYHPHLKAECRLSRAPKLQAEWDSRDSCAVLASAVPSQLP